MLKRLATWARTQLTPYSDAGSPSPAAPSEVEVVDNEAARWKQRALTAERRADELFEACCSFERQRDQWQNMFKQQSFEHLAAQTTQSGIIERQIAYIRSALRMLIELREKVGLPPMDVKKHHLQIDAYGNTIHYAEEFLARRRAALEAGQKLFAINPMACVTMPNQINNTNVLEDEPLQLCMMPPDNVTP